MGAEAPQPVKPANASNPPKPAKEKHTSQPVTRKSAAKKQNRSKKRLNAQMRALNREKDQLAIVAKDRKDDQNINGSSFPLSAMSPDGTLKAVMSDAVITLYDGDTSAPLFSSPIPNGMNPQALKFSTESYALEFSSKSGSITTFDLQSRKFRSADPMVSREDGSPETLDELSMLRMFHKLELKANNSSIEYAPHDESRKETAPSFDISRRSYSKKLFASVNEDVSPKTLRIARVSQEKGTIQQELSQLHHFHSVETKANANPKLGRRKTVGGTTGASRKRNVVRDIGKAFREAEANSIPLKRQQSSLGGKERTSVRNQRHKMTAHKADFMKAFEKAEFKSIPSATQSSGFTSPSSKHVKQLESCSVSSTPRRFHMIAPNTSKLYFMLTGGAIKIKPSMTGCDNPATKRKPSDKNVTALLKTKTLQQKYEMQGTEKTSTAMSNVGKQQTCWYWALYKMWDGGYWIIGSEKNLGSAAAHIQRWFYSSEHQVEIYRGSKTWNSQSKFLNEDEYVQFIGDRTRVADETVHKIFVNVDKTNSKLSNLVKHEKKQPKKSHVFYIVRKLQRGGLMSLALVNGDARYWLMAISSNRSEATKILKQNFSVSEIKQGIGAIYSADIDRWNSSNKFLDNNSFQKFLDVATKIGKDQASNVNEVQSPSTAKNSLFWVVYKMKKGGYWIVSEEKSLEAANSCIKKQFHPSEDDVMVFSGERCWTNARFLDQRRYHDFRASRSRLAKSRLTKSTVRLAKAAVQPKSASLETTKSKSKSKKSLATKVQRKSESCVRADKTEAKHRSTFCGLQKEDALLFPWGTKDMWNESQRCKKRFINETKGSASRSESQGISTNPTSDYPDKWGYTELMYAVLTKKPKLVGSLLKSKSVDIMAKNKHGETALDLAKQYKYKRLVTMLTSE